MSKKLSYKRLKKAYRINFNMIEEGYLASEQVCHAGTLGKAKSILLDKIRYDSWKRQWTGKEITFLNIPVERCKGYDIFDFEGEKKTQYEIDNILLERKRLNHLDELSKSDVKYFFIRKNGFYYLPKNCGYTDDRHQAGIYEKDDAINSAKWCRDIILVPIDIKEHNESIEEKIKELKSKILV